MQYITKNQIIRQFAAYRPNDEVILIKDITIGDQVIPAPIHCIVTNVTFINKKAEATLPKYRKNDIVNIKIDPDLIVYDLCTTDGTIRTKAFEHALMPVTRQTDCFSETDCQNMYCAKHKRFRRIIQTRRKNRIMRSGMYSLIMFMICMFLCFSTFNRETIGRGIAFALISLVICLALFASGNRRIERIHMK